MELTATYRPCQHEVPVQGAEALATTVEAASTAAASDSKCESEEQELLSKLRGLSQQEDTAELTAGALYLCLLPMEQTVLLQTATHLSPSTATAYWDHEHSA